MSHSNKQNQTKKNDKGIAFKNSRPIVEETTFEDEEKPISKYLSNTMKFLNIGLFIPVFSFLAIFALKTIFQFDLKLGKCHISSFLKRYVATQWNFEGKINFLVTALSFNAYFLFAIVLSIVMLRAFYFRPNPQAETDPILIVTLNRVIQNTIEQSFVFFGILSSYVLNFCPYENKEFLVLLVVSFYAARVVFLIGSLFNLLTKVFALRMSGIIVNVMINLILISKIFGCKYFEDSISSLLSIDS